MSAENQFTALGPAAVGFQTHGANIDVGAEISGNTVGIRGSCQGPVGDGVQGQGTGNLAKSLSEQVVSSTTLKRRMPAARRHECLW